MSSSDWQNTPFTLPLLLNGLLCGWMAYVGWRRRAVPGAVPFVVLMAALAGWALVNLVEKSLVNYHLRLPLSIFTHVFIVTVPGAWLVFAARFSRQDSWLPQRLVPLLLVVPLLTLALAFTNSYHGLFYSHTEMAKDGPYTYMAITHGPLFFGYAAYDYLLFAVGAALLLFGATRQPGWTVVRLAVVLGAMLVPVFGNVAYVFHLQPRRWTDLTPIYFAVAGLASAWLLFRVRIFDVLPIARDFVLDCLSDAVFVLDTRSRILDANLVARSLLPDPPGLRKKRLAEVLPGLGRYLPGGASAAESATEIQLGQAGAERFWDLHVLPLVDQGVMMGTLVRLTEATERRRAAEARSRLAAIVESGEDAIIGQSLDGVILSWNPGAERLYGYSGDEVQGKPFSILFPDDHANELPAIIEQLRLGKRIEPYEIVHVRKDGLRVDVSLSISPTRNDAGLVVGASAIGRNVTARKRAEAELQEAESRFRQLAENIDGVFWMRNARKPEMLFVSPAYERIWGRSCQSLYERSLSFLEAIHPEDRERIADMVRRLLDGQHTNAEYRVVRPDGSVSWVWDRGFPIKDREGQTYRVCGIAEDITARKQVEEALDQQAKQLKEADRRKDRFLATLAHELRNPLAPIRSALDLLMMPEPGPGVDAYAKAIMNRQIQQLVRLVDDLLDVSRITRDQIELRKERVELATVVARAVETARPLIDARRHELNLALPSEPVWLEADLVRLAQVISNLLSNAAKYTEEGGRIWLSAEHEGAEVVLRVRDTGMGIEREMLQRIFDQFVQADQARSRAQGGLGIGLSLVRKLVEMHAGSVKAESEGLNRGSEFVVRLSTLSRTRQDEPKETSTKALAARASPALRLLVVDDNRDAAESLTLLLRLLGHEVWVAHDGPTALELARNQRPDVAFLDLGMLGMDGYELCRRLRALSGFAEVLVVALTGWGQEEDRRRAREAGFDRYLVKPVEPHSLKRMLTHPRQAGLDEHSLWDHFSAAESPEN